MKPKVSKILKELRALNKKTQGQIAEVLGITRQAYSRYESSSRQPSLETLAKLSEYYNVSPQYFFTGSVDKTADSEMDIVELSAIYQAKKTAQARKQKEDEKSPDSENNQEDLKTMKDMLFNKLDYGVKLENVSKNSTISGKDNINITQVPEPIKKKTRIKMFLFYFLILLALVNIGMMTIHRMDPSYEYSIFNHSFINAISPGQNVSQTMYTDIVKITEFNVDNISIGDNVVVYSDYGVDEYWVEEIVSIDRDLEELSVTYDNVSAQTVPFNLVLGEFQSDANIFGTIYYSAKFNIGYYLLLAAHGFILTFIYYSFTSNKGSRR